MFIHKVVFCRLNLGTKFLCKWFLYLGICAFALNSVLLGGLLDLITIMGCNGDNCSDCSHSLLSDICTSFAVNLLMECELLTLRLFSANCNFVTLSGICDANGCSECELILELGSVNCGTNGVFNGEVVNCDANASLQLGELTLSDVGNRGANGRFNICTVKFDFKMLLNFKELLSVYL